MYRLISFACVILLVTMTVDAIWNNVYFNTFAFFMMSGVYMLIACYDAHKQEQEQENEIK